MTNLAQGIQLLSTSGILMMDNIIISLSITWSMIEDQPLKFRGKFQEAESINKNPSYPKKWMDQNLDVITPCMKLNKLGE